MMITELELFGDCRVDSYEPSDRHSTRKVEAVEVPIWDWAWIHSKTLEQVFKTRNNKWNSQREV